jgi:hypothetical protein
MSIHMNSRGKQLEYICTVDMDKMLGAQGYARMHMENIEHHISCIWTYYSLLLDLKCGVVLDHMVI